MNSVVIQPSPCTCLTVSGWFAVLLLPAQVFGVLDGGQDAIPPAAYVTAPIGGLGATDSTASVVDVNGPDFSQARRIEIGLPSEETNATQMNIGTSLSVAQGDILLAEIWLRGSRPDGEAAIVEFHFEKSTAPWTKSATETVRAHSDPGEWRRALIPVTSAESYAPGQAMVSVRLAFGPQTVELGAVRLFHFGADFTFDDLSLALAMERPLGELTIQVFPEATRQTLKGLGGNFAQPRYGHTEPMDDVGTWNLEHLQVAHARVGFPLDHWNPEPGVFRTDGPAGAAMEAMRKLSERGLPLVLSIWEGPLWMLGGEREQTGRTLPENQYDACIEAIVRYLVTARDVYGVEPDFVSFNEPDYGVNFRFTPGQMRDFILRAAPEFEKNGIATRWLTGDTANGRNLVAYATPLLDDPSLLPHLGPLSFHSWDALSVTDEDYRAIAALGEAHNREIWCLEAGHDPQLWRRPHPWGTWDNAFRTAHAYARTVRLSGASLMSYWTYQHNYPLWNPDTAEPYPVFHVMRQMGQVIRPGAVVADTGGEAGGPEVLFTVGPEEDAFALLIVNPDGAGEIEFSDLPPAVAVTITAACPEHRGIRKSGMVSEDGTLRVSVAALSVVTVVAETEMRTTWFHSLSARARVDYGDGALSAGFLVGPGQEVELTVRALGPSLPVDLVPIRLEDPMVQVFRGEEVLLENAAFAADPFYIRLQELDLSPGDSREGAAVRTLDAGSYLADIRPETGGPGVALLQLVPASPSVHGLPDVILAYAGVGTGHDVLIAGFIIEGKGTMDVLIRALGPSLDESGVLADPVLHLFHESQHLEEHWNRRWREGPRQAEIAAAGKQPTHENEAAVLATLTPGLYTAHLRGHDGAGGFALIEVSRF